MYITLGCFDDVSGIDYPSIICLIDTSIIGKYVDDLWDSLKD